MLKLLAAFGNSARLRINLAVVVIFLIALWVCLPGITHYAQEWKRDTIPSWVGALPGQAKKGERICDVDTRLIHLGFLAAPRFKDTTRWLTGIWVGQVPFYRPLTSYVFWAQWRLWGDHEVRYNLLAITFHLLAVAALARLASTLLRFYRLPYPLIGTLFTGLLFVYGLGVLSKQDAITNETYMLWKNQPDALTLLFFSCTLTAYVEQKSRSGRSRQHALLSAFWYVLLCLTKEAGVFLPLLLPLIEATELCDARTRRTAVFRLLPFAFLLTAYLGLRAVFLHDAVGYRYGSNGSWLYRFFFNTSGGLGEAIAMHSTVVLTDIVALCLVVVYVLWLKRRDYLPFRKEARLIHVAALLTGPIVIFLGAALVVAFLNQSMARGFYFDAALLQLFFWDYFGLALGATTFLLCVGQAFRQRPHFAVLCYAWVLLTLALTLFSPSVLHRYYLMNAGFAILLSGGAMLWIAPLVDSLVQRVQQARILSVTRT